MDLNSVLIEGVLMESKGKRDKSGWWLTILSRGRNEEKPGRRRFRVELPNNIHEKVLAGLEHGVKLRVVGRLERESRLGTYVKAEHLETGRLYHENTPRA